MPIKWILFTANILLFVYCTYKNFRVSLGKYDEYTWKEELFDSASFYAYPIYLGYIFSCLMVFFLIIYQIKHPVFTFKSKKIFLILLFSILIYFIPKMYSPLEKEIFNMKYELEVLAIIFWVISLYWILFC